MSSAWRRGPLRALATQTAIVTIIGLGLAAPAAATEGQSRGDDRKAAAAGTSKDSTGKSEKARGGSQDDRHEPKGEQPVSKADRNSGGANGQCSDTTEDEGYFCGTERDKPSGNGEGDGKATGKPWQAHRGKADNKNPRGQSENDHNNGYECDGNKGIAKGNPAHTSCEGEDEPENPGNPGTPGNPGNPGGPGTPENPGNPGTPENPGNPGTPENPGTPGNPGGTPNVSTPPVIGGVETLVPSTKAPVVKGVETLVPRAGVEGRAAVPQAVAAGAGVLPATGATSLTTGLSTLAVALLAAGGALLARRRLSLR